jgi:hypothetical protein
MINSFVVKSFVLAASVAVVLCRPAWAQNQNPPTVKPRSEAVKKNEDPQREQQQRVLVLERLKREHSDQDGHLRPDLYAKAIAQRQRMKVANQIGPDPKIAESGAKP